VEGGTSPPPAKLQNSLFDVLLLDIHLYIEYRAIELRLKKLSLTFRQAAIPMRRMMETIIKMIYYGS
jgi:hypothetical protein